MITLEQDKLLFGNPCPQTDWNKTVQTCKSVAKHNPEFIAIDVFRTFDINVNMNTVPGSNDYTSLCPLDIQNQDAFTVIRASLDALLLEGQYWEVYADEFGEARFVLILDQGNPNSQISSLPEIRYCIPGAKMDQLVDLVIVRGSTPIPQFSCGDQEIIVLDPDQPIYQDLCANGNIFTREPFDASTSAVTALGTKVEWGIVAESRWAPGVSDACDIGKFRQYGTVVYPEYDRKQVYKDNISDPIEIGPFQQIVAWLVDLDFVNFNTDDLKYYDINFTSGSTELPVRLNDGNSIVGNIGAGDLKDYFPLECDLSSRDSNQLCLTPQEVLKQMLDAFLRLQSAGACNTPKDAIFRGNAYATEKCGGDPVENIYQQTTQIIATGFPLRGSYAVQGATETQYFFGIQTEHQTIQLSQGEHWVELPYSFGTPVREGYSSDPHMTFGLRFKAPPGSTYRIYDSAGGDTGWVNPFYAFLGQLLTSGIQGQSGYIGIQKCWDYEPPGYLVGINDGLWTIDEKSLYAKINVSRPGIQLKGAGKDIRPLLRSISMKVKPIYQYSMQQPVAACGVNFCQIIDPSSSLYDNIWCTKQDTSDSDMEKLKNAMTGITMEINISALFPIDISDTGYRTAAEKCLKVAQDLYAYYNSFRNEPYKGYTYVCGPPTTQDEIPRLGYSVRTPHGLRTVNSINYNYQDGQSYNLNIEVGPAMFVSGGAGQLYRKQTENATVTGKVVQVLEGALYKVDIHNYGVISAYNAAKWPWEIGDVVQLELYNVPKEA